MNRNTAPALDPVWRPKLHSGLRMEVIEGEAIVLDQANDRVHHLNEVATFILAQCTGHMTQAAIVEVLVERYDVDPRSAATDTAQLIATLRNHEIIM